MSTRETKRQWTCTCKTKTSKLEIYLRLSLKHSTAELMNVTFRPPAGEKWNMEATAKPKTRIINHVRKKSSLCCLEPQPNLLMTVQNKVLRPTPLAFGFVFHKGSIQWVIGGTGLLVTGVRRCFYCC